MLISVNRILYANRQETSSIEIKTQNSVFTEYSPFPKKTVRLLQIFSWRAAGFVAYLRGHNSTFNYINSKFSLDFDGSCIWSKLNDTTLWYDMDGNTQDTYTEQTQTGETDLQSLMHLTCGAQDTFHMEKLFSSFQKWNTGLNGTNQLNLVYNYKYSPFGFPAKL